MSELDDDTVVKLITDRFDLFDARLRDVEKDTKVIEATMVTWRRLLAVLASVAVIASVAFGLAVNLGDRLWGA